MTRRFDTCIGLALVPRQRIIQLLRGIKQNHLNNFVWCVIPKTCRFSFDVDFDLPSAL